MGGQRPQNKVLSYLWDCWGAMRDSSSLAFSSKKGLPHWAPKVV